MMLDVSRVSRFGFILSLFGVLCLLYLHTAVYTLMFSKCHVYHIYSLSKDAKNTQTRQKVGGSPELRGCVTLKTCSNVSATHFEPQREVVRESLRSLLLIH